MNQPNSFQQEVQDRVIHKLGEQTAQIIELGAMGDAMAAQTRGLQERGTALQGFADSLTGALAVRWLSGADGV